MGDSLRLPAAGVSSRWRLWAGRGTAAFADQLLSSGANFALSIILARALPEVEYGLFAVAFAVFLLAATLYQGLLLTPSLVLGTTLYAERKPEYVAAMARLHFPLSAALAGLLGAVALVLGSPALGAMAIAAPCVLLWWLARSAWYLRLQPGPAALGSLMYVGTMMGGIALLSRLGRLDSVSGILAMGVAGLVAGGWLLIRIGPDWRGTLAAGEVWREGWRYGSWEMGIALAAWIPASLCYPVTAAVLGAVPAAELRATQNFALPVTQATTSALRLAQPYVSGKLAAGAGAAQPGVVWRLTGLVSAAALSYLAVVTALREPLVHALYGGKFTGKVDLLFWMVLPAVLAAGTECVATGVRAMRGSRPLLLAYLVSGAVYLSTGIAAARAYGLAGVAGTLIAANAAALGTVIVLFRGRSAGEAAR